MNEELFKAKWFDSLSKLCLVLIISFLIWDWIDWQNLNGQSRTALIFGSSILYIIALIQILAPYIKPKNKN